MAKVECPVCFSAADTSEYSKNNAIWERWVCPRCGQFYMSRICFYPIRATGESADQNNINFGPKGSRLRADLSAWIRENEGRGLNRGLNIDKPFTRKDSSDPNRLGFETARSQVRTSHDRADKLLRFIGRSSDFLGQDITIQSPEWEARAWAKNKKEMVSIIKYLKKEELIEERRNGVYRITIEGSDYLEKLDRANPESQQGFVAMWFRDETRPAWDKAFRPAIDEAGYDPFRIDLKHHVNPIDEEIITEIKSSLFLIADLTGHRGGVYYEAGFAKAIGLPVIYTCRSDEWEKRHFDIEHYPCIEWNDDELENFKEELCKPPLVSATQK